MDEIDTSQKVREFYNKTPFPDYDLNRFKTRQDLINAAYPFAIYLDKIIPKNASIIDVGCGTGQLCAYLSLKRKKVFGVDFSEGSLNKAKTLKKKLKLNNLTLQFTDILNLDMTKRFDYVLCNGVLHHTADPYLGFQNAINLLKPNGFIMLGLYNKFGRKILEFKRFLLKSIFLNNEKIKDYFMKNYITYLDDKLRVNAWFQDQFKHPHETTHTVREILKWFKKNDIRYINSIPSLKLFENFSLEFENLFYKDGEINMNSNYLLVQLKWIYSKANEGGYFITIGQK